MMPLERPASLLQVFPSWSATSQDWAK
jgi:hypothetical protein